MSQVLDSNSNNKINYSSIFNRSGPVNVINLRATHKRASVSALESLSFRNRQQTLDEIRALDGITECAIIQTCNRVELYLIPKKGTISSKILKKVKKYWQTRSIVTEREFEDIVEEVYDAERHLMRLASGLESMIIGEDQILGQVKEAFEQARLHGTVGPSLTQLFESAIRTGNKVRQTTKISTGIKSLGAAAVNVAEEIMGSLHGKKILLIGAGLIGAVVGKTLAHKKLEKTHIYVINRDEEKSLKLAQNISAEACNYNQLPVLLTAIDLAIVTSTAPHFVITRTDVQKALEKRNESKLLIIDLSQPRNVEKEVADFPQVDLRNIDSLRKITDSDTRTRLHEIKKAEKIVNSNVRRFKLALNRKSVEPLISSIFYKAESHRKKELKKTIRMMGGLNGKQEKILDDLSRILIRRTLQQPITNLRKAAEDDDAQAIAAATRLFGKAEPIQ